MGHEVFTTDRYVAAREKFEVTEDVHVTRRAEERAQETGRLSPLVDPSYNPMRYSKIRKNPHGTRWYATVGCPMDIEVSCDTTGSMGGEVDTEMRILPQLYEAIAKVLPGYDPQLCLGNFQDVCDGYPLCRPQFEMQADKIVEYLKEMVPCRAGGDAAEDSQYAMLARAYLTNAYTNLIGLKGYHFIITDASCHVRFKADEIREIFGENILENELQNLNVKSLTMEKVIKDLKSKTHQFVLVVGYHESATDFWRDYCGDNSVIEIPSTLYLPEIISAIIGLTEGTMDITDLKQHLGRAYSNTLIEQLSSIDIGAQAKLRAKMPHPVPKKGDIFLDKEDIWPIQDGDDVAEEPHPEESATESGTITYL